MHQLNAETKKYGIEFPINEVQFGKAVHFLEVSVYLDGDNIIQYSPYSKPTDAKRYLNPNSFHPKSVFNAIPFSQMLRTMRNSSKPEIANSQLELVSKHFENSGYNPEKLLELKEKVINKVTVIRDNKEEKDTLVFPVHYFEGIRDFKGVIHSLRDELEMLIGDVHIMFAMKKRSSIRNTVVRNKQISTKNCTSSNQRCHGGGCLQCPLVITEPKITINGRNIAIPRNLDCKSKNVIYLWLCKLCMQKEAYFGRAIQECHDRTSSHRSCFSESKWEKSALSMHAKDMHQNQFSLNNFSVALAKKVSPQQLRREEFRFIDKYRNIPFGMNRYKV